MKISSAYLLMVLGVLIFGCAQKEKQIPRDIASIEAIGGMEGIWFLQGSSSTRGPYNGELEFRRGSDGTFDVIRIATYINYFFDGLKVQEVWKGKAVVSGGLVTIMYELRQGDFIYRMNGLRREDTSFKNPITVIARLQPSPNGLATKYTDKKDSDYAEWLTSKRALEKKPLWVDERRFEQATGPSVPATIRKNIQKFKSQIAFDKDPLVKASKSKVAFKNETPVVIIDPTDYEFYRSNKDTIRITNKVTDNINITEAVVKRNAYGPSLNDKAYGYDANVAGTHFNEADLIVATRVDDNGRFVSFTKDVDAGFSTGMYLASQAMRYQFKKEEAALNNLRRSLRGILNLIEISEPENTMARSIAAYETETDLPKNWRRGTGKFQNFIWTNGGGVETMTGVLQGLIWAKLALPSVDPALQNEISSKLRSLSQRKLMGLSEFEQNLLSGVAAAWSGDKELLAAFRPTITSPESFYWNGAADWTGSSLATLNQVNYTLLNEILGNKTARDQWRERLMNDWITFEPAHRHLATLAAYGFSYRQQVQGARFLASSSADKFQKSLNEAVWGLKEIPFPRPSLQIRIDHSLSPGWSVSPVPQNFWNKDIKAVAKKNNFQGLYSYPAFELHAFSSKFMWNESAFEHQVTHEKGIENAGVDYLYAYWLAKYAGVENVH